MHMKTKFKEFYKYSDSEIKTIWNECIFIFDTNVLIDLYRYSKESSDKYINILKKIKKEKRIWIPHQVGLEYHKRRIIQISELKDSYSWIKDTIETSIKNAQNKIDGKYHKEHPFLDLGEIDTNLEMCLKKVVEIINKTEKHHPDWFNNDTILDKLDKLFIGNVGDGYPEEKLNEIYKEGEKRYANCIPPGYKDEFKNDDERKYGDFILWCQIIDKAKESNKPIIFITRDKKEDWWWKQSGNTIGPRYELKKEILDKAKIDFHMYDSERFLKYAFEYYKQSVDEDVLEEIKRVQSFKEHNYMMPKILRSRELKSQFLPDLIMQQERLNGELLHLSRKLGFDDEISFEINTIQEKIMHYMSRSSREERPNPLMLEGLSMLQERIQRVFIDLINNNKITIEQVRFLAHFFEKMNESYMMLMNDVDKYGISEKYLNKMEMNSYTLKRYLRGFE